MTSGENNLQVAEEVATLLAEHHIDCVVIGAIAMAGHHYVRFTEDIDLGVADEVNALSNVAKLLSQRVYKVGDMEAVKATCKKYRLRGLNPILKELEDSKS